MATILSAIIAIKITRKLLRKPLLKASVKEAANIGPGLTPPKRPNIKILEIWTKIPIFLSYCVHPKLASEGGTKNRPTRKRIERFLLILLNF